MRHLNYAWLSHVLCLTGLLCPSARGEESAPALRTGPGGMVSKPLGSSKGTSGKSLFTLLPSSETGIDLVNPILPAHPMSYLYASAMGLRRNCGGGC